jgi:hypothetical protein
MPLAAGQGLRLAVEEVEQVEQPSGLFDAGPALLLADTGHLEREGHVLGDGHVGVERVVLEDHRDVAVLGREVGDVAVPDVDRAGGHLFQAGEHPQRGGLAAAGGSDEDHELAVLDLEFEIPHGGGVGARIDPLRLVVGDRCHDDQCSFTGRNVPDDP